MKTFLNVLYRRVLYKIPLKFLLLLLAIVSVFIACFSNAVDYEVIFLDGPGNAFKYRQLQSTQTFDNSLGHLACFQIERDQANCPNEVCGTLHMGNDTAPVKGWSYMTCTKYAGEITLTSNYTNQYYTIIVGIDSLYPNYTSLQCQNEYNLIPISEIDQSYCESNNLCPSGGGSPSDCPNIGVSNLFINDLFHPGAFNVVINIPEEIDWDYAYTNSGQNFNLDVVGYNVDYEKIGAIVDNQSYIPTSEDFINIIGVLAPYTKIIVFFVFLFIVWAWIKKPFKSKKL